MLLVDQAQENLPSIRFEVKSFIFHWFDLATMAGPDLPLIDAERLDIQ